MPHLPQASHGGNSGGSGPRTAARARGRAQSPRQRHDHGHHWHDDDGFSVGGRPGRDWYKLAEAHAGKLIDRDEIDVRTDRAFTAIRLRVFEAPVEINSVRVYFRNGENRNLPVRQHIERGGSTRVIDLPGERRIISKVVCWYNTPASARRDARVEIWGHR